jgi:hypothetical protein
VFVAFTLWITQKPWGNSLPVFNNYNPIQQTHHSLTNFQHATSQFHYVKISKSINQHSYLKYTHSSLVTTVGYRYKSSTKISESILWILFAAIQFKIKNIVYLIIIILYISKLYNNYTFLIYVHLFPNSWELVLKHLVVHNWFYTTFPK